jgi:anti-sigma-K factor RskA
MSEPGDIDALAAEYVVGTLEAGERTAVAARRQREAALDAAIAAWELRLAPLLDTVPAVPAPPGLLAGIEARLEAGSVAAAAAGSMRALEARARRWRGLAIAASALAASLLLVIAVREAARPPAASSYVAVFQKDDASPAFLLTVDLERRTLSIRAVAAAPAPGKSYQLWIASDRLGPAPRSLGLIEAADAPTRRTLAFDRGLIETATFGVSLEPAGGSPTGRPTGPALHARLIEAPR